MTIEYVNYLKHIWKGSGMVFGIYLSAAGLLMKESSSAETYSLSALRTKPTTSSPTSKPKEHFVPTATTSPHIDRPS